MEKKTILLIDDDTSLLTTLGDFLSFEGYEVVGAESGEAGLAKLEAVRPDLIILDMSMPGMGGMGFLERISEQGKPRYPVLVLTARASMAEFFANVEVDGFVAKPCDPSDLLMEVGRIVFLRSGQEGEPSAEVKAARKVLVGEDSPQTREALGEAFAAEGCVAHFAARGPEVIERAVLEKPDAVVVKLALPGMSGDVTAGALTQMATTAGIPLVVYDAAGEEGAGKRVSENSGGVAIFVAGGDAAQVVAAVVSAVG